MKTVMVNYGGFSAEQQVEENLYEAIYQQGRVDIIDKLDNIMSFHQEGLSGYWTIDIDDWNKIYEEFTGE